MKQTICVVIQTFNEEKNIKACIESARLLTHNIIVVDTESNDKTVDLVKKMNIPLYVTKNTRYVEPVRRLGIEKAQTDWILILDADERLTKILSQEIIRKIEDQTVTHYRISRKNFFANKKWLSHGGWYPDFQLRLIKKSAFIDWPSRIHATPNINGKGAHLTNSLIHFFHPSLTEMLNKTLLFEEVESELLFKAERNVNTSIFFRKYFGELNRRLMIRRGYLDGTYGIIESAYQAFSKTITYLFLYEKKQKSSSL